MGEIFSPGVVRAAVHPDRDMPLGKLETGRALHVDGVSLRLRQQPLAHENHRSILEPCDARPLEWRLLKEGVAYSRTRRQLDGVFQAPILAPFVKLFLELPARHPLVRHNLSDHRLRKLPVHFSIGQKQRDRLVTHNRAGQLLAAIALLKVNGHREDKDALRMINLLGARTACEVLDVEEDVHTRTEHLGQVATRVKGTSGSTVTARVQASVQTPPRSWAAAPQSGPHDSRAGAIDSACGCGRQWRLLQRAAER
eukprot:4273549-Prymnesium_polylepis.2